MLPVVRMGFALTRVDEEEARRTYQYLAQIGALGEEGLAPLSEGLEPLQQKGLAP